MALIERNFPELLALLFPADNYAVEISEAPGVASLHLFPALAPKNCIRLNNPTSADVPASYSFSVLPHIRTMVMDFRAFEVNSRERFATFADSMFRACRQEDIENLIIDVRHNGGGDSHLGDELLKYLTDKPYSQFGPCIIHNTPFTRSLMKLPGMAEEFATQPEGNIETTFKWIMPSEAGYERYTGNVYLLINHSTFSSASSCAWIFQKLGIGTVIGEETGGMSVCYGNIVSGSLPASGLHWSISFAKMYLWEATDEDVHGTMPDVEIPSDQALEYVLALIEKQRSGQMN